MAGCNSRWYCSGFSEGFVLNSSWFKKEKNNTVFNKQDGDRRFDLAGSFLPSELAKTSLSCRKMRNSGIEMQLACRVLA